MKKKEKRENPSKSREKYLIFTGVKGEVQLGDVGAKDGRRKKEKRGKRSGLDPQGLSDARHVR